MQTVAVTGGSGKLGAWVIKLLQEEGYRVVSLDERRSDHLKCKQLKINLTDLGQVVGGLQGAEAVIHLAAIPAPRGFTNEYIFTNNVQSTYHVFEAAALLGIRKVVAGSSESSYGFAWAPVPFSPDYVPVDEDHPQQPQECYGLSKIVGEKTGEMFHRRTGMQVMSLRYSMIVAQHEYASMAARDPARFSKTLWSYIDIRDAASATLAAMRSDAGGCHALNITADDTLSDWSTSRLLERFYPDVPAPRRPLPDRQAIVSNERAKRVLDWRPQFRWEHFVEQS